MGIRLIASDLDGTIIDKNYRISNKNFLALDRIHKKQLKFVICTGKSYAVSRKACREFKASYGIFGNGTQIIDLKTGKEIWKSILLKEDLLFTITFAKRYGFHVHLYTDTDIITEKLEFMDLRNYIISNKELNKTLKFNLVDDILEYVENNDLSVYSAIVSSENIPLREFQKVLSINKNIDCTFINKRGKYRDNIINKDYEYINITPININKGIALDHLLKHLKIDKKDILAIGDNINDLEMIREAGIGVAVNEALDNIKDVADYITSTTASDGAFAEAINKFI